ncbi:hypothetical protein [Glutamicibacter halophytocola]|uniref:hypothetical protein n=1 Tax=Glutamicibacter halophytocola TaxID=1933880 RepID=UPI0018928C82|nr:hypothetical protein [Glutamicibacter halophytocola]
MKRELDASERSLFEGMLRTIRKRSHRNNLRKNLHDSKRRLDRIGFSVPPHMVDFQTPVGWAEKTVSVPASRIRPEGFRLPGNASALADLKETFEGRYVARSLRGAIKSSMKHGPAFVFTSKGVMDAGEPEVVISVRSALESTCIMDPRTGTVSAALEVLDGSKTNLHVPGWILAVDRVDGRWVVVEKARQDHDVVGCEPFIWDWDIDRPFGRSRITRPLIGSIERGVRTLLRMEVTAEFFSAPQRALLGASEEHFTDKDGKPIDVWKAITGGIWALPDIWDDEEGKLVRAQLQQLSQASMQPHSDMFKSIGLQVASETSMPMSYLGIQENQPASADAIRAAEADMVSLIEYQIELSYESAMLNLARKVLAVKRGASFASVEADTRGLSIRFADPGTPTVAARSDAALKYAQAFPTGDPELSMELYGLSDDQISRNMDYMRKSEARSMLDRMANPQGNADSEQPANEPAPKPETEPIA